MHLRRGAATSLQVFSIAQAGERFYPLITPIGSVSSAKFLPEIPLSAAATVIIPGEIIPNYNQAANFEKRPKVAWEPGSF